MLVEELIQELQQLPLTAFVAVKYRPGVTGVSIDRVTYDSGEALIHLEGADDDGNYWDSDNMRELARQARRVTA